jgi:hypothetical protein
MQKDEAVAQQMRNQVITFFCKASPLGSFIAFTLALWMVNHY